MTVLVELADGQIVDVTPTEDQKGRLEATLNRLLAALEARLDLEGGAFRAAMERHEPALPADAHRGEHTGSPLAHAITDIFALGWQEGRAYGHGEQIVEALEVTVTKVDAIGAVLEEALGTDDAPAPQTPQSIVH